MADQDVDQLTVPPDGRSPAEQPRWRQDFPIDWPQDEYISRREFIKFLLLTSAAFTTGQFWFLVQDFIQSQAAPSPSLPIARVEDIAVGQSLVFKYPENGPSRLLIRLDTETFVAYEQQCTHLTCPVIPRLDRDDLYCPCHEGIFDLRSGRPIAGPPQRPLARITLTIEDGLIIATGIERRTV
jgi:Rieske Fe-S protein